MEGNFDRALSSWMAFLSVDKLNIKAYGLDFLFFLRKVQLDETILRAAVMFCDLEFHVFKFGPTLKELFPIVKEFKALFGYLKRSQVIYPPY